MQESLSHHLKDVGIPATNEFNTYVKTNKASGCTYSKVVQTLKYVKQDNSDKHFAREPNGVHIVKMSDNPLETK